MIAKAASKNRIFSSAIEIEERDGRYFLSIYGKPGQVGKVEPDVMQEIFPGEPFTQTIHSRGHKLVSTLVLEPRSI